MLASLAGYAVAARAEPVGTAFSYQASLELDGSPVNENADFEFTLWDASSNGTQVAPLVAVNGVAVDNGLLTVMVDFGNAAFADEARWLQLAVRTPAGGGAFHTLSPRQRIRPTPHSIATHGITVNDTGNVGIGTPSPTEKLHVAGNLWTEGMLRIGHTITMAAPGAGYDWITSSYNSLNFPMTDVVVERRIGAGFGPLPWPYRPEAPLHALFRDLPNYVAGLPLWEEDSVVEDSSAWMGLYYNGHDPNEGGGYGAGITLAKCAPDQNGNDAFDKWAIFRDAGASDLNVTYGFNINPTNNPLKLQVETNGDTLLCPVAGRAGVGALLGAGLTPQTTLHAYLQSNSASEPVAIFQKQRPTSNNAVQVGGSFVDVYNMDGGADPTFYLNYIGTGDVVLAYGGGALGGNVGIGTSSPTERLDVTGTARLRGIAVGGVGTVNVLVDANGKLWKAASSRRYKTNVRPLPMDAGAVLKLQPVAFDWRSTGTSDVGVIAEDVAEVLPELVVRDEAGRPESVQYDKMALYLLEVVKQQQARLAALDGLVEQNRALQDQIDDLKQSLRQQSSAAD